MNQILPYNRQQTIYLLPFPIEISDVILSFAFYDKETGESRKKHHYHMCKIVFRFANADVSRFRGFYWTIHDSDTHEHWAICLNNTEEDEETLFQGINCKNCGEYKHQTAWDFNPPYCFCE